MQPKIHKHNVSAYRHVDVHLEQGYHSHNLKLRPLDKCMQSTSVA